MHPRSATLVAYCDAESGAWRSRRILKHLSRCQKCRNEVKRIQGEKVELSAGAALSPIEGGSGLAGVLSAIAAWREGRPRGASSELRNRLRSQIEIYFGFPAVSMVERSALRPEELLGKATGMLDVFLGPAAGEAVRDNVLRGLDGTELAVETYR